MSQLESVFLLDAARTPFGPNRGGLPHICIDDLAAPPIAEFVARHSDLDLNDGTEHIAGISDIALDGLDMFVHSDEGMEGATAFAEIGPPDLWSYR